MKFNSNAFKITISKPALNNMFFLSLLQNFSEPKSNRHLQTLNSLSLKCDLQLLSVSWEHLLANSFKRSYLHIFGEDNNMTLTKHPLTNEIQPKNLLHWIEVDVKHHFPVIFPPKFLGISPPYFIIWHFSKMFTSWKALEIGTNLLLLFCVSFYKWMLYSGQS